RGRSTPGSTSARGAGGGRRRRSRSAACTPATCSRLGRIEGEPERGFAEPGDGVRGHRSSGARAQRARAADGPPDTSNPAHVVRVHVAGPVGGTDLLSEALL